jgi:hypothetical protein
VLCRLFDRDIEESARGEGLGSRNAPKERSGFLVLSEYWKIELQILPRPGTVGVDDSQSPAVRAESPSCVNRDPFDYNLPPRAVQWFCPRDDDYWQGRRAEIAGVETAPIAVVGTPGNRKAQDSKQRDDRNVCDGSHAGRGPEQPAHVLEPRAEGSDGRFGRGGGARQRRQYGPSAQTTT